MAEEENKIEEDKKEKEDKEEKEEDKEEENKENKRRPDLSKLEMSPGWECSVDTGSC